MNVVQENSIRGKVRGWNGEDKWGRKKTRKVSGIKAVDADTKFNKELWGLTEKMVQDRSSGNYTTLLH